MCRSHQDEPHAGITRLVLAFLFFCVLMAYGESKAGENVIRDNTLDSLAIPTTEAPCVETLVAAMQEQQGAGQEQKKTDSEAAKKKGKGVTCASNPADANTLVPTNTYTPAGQLISPDLTGAYCTGTGSNICKSTSKDRPCPFPATSGTCRDTYNSTTGVCACKCL